MTDKHTVIDLFSGCGGFSYGFQQAGYHVIIGVDNNKIALDTFGMNHENSKTLLLDLHEDSSIEKIVHAKGNQLVDVIIAGPPCQGFSLTGSRKENDERNTLFNAVFRLAKKVNPKVIIIENVQGLLTLYKGKAKKDIINLCEELGYNCTPKLLYAPDFGVPQIRKRVFFVALKKELGVFEFLNPHIPNDYVGCKNAIGDLPDLDKSYGAEEMKYDKKAASYYQKMMREGSNVIKNHIGTKHTEHVIDVISQVPEGGNHKDLPPGVGTLENLMKPGQIS